MASRDGQDFHSKVTAQARQEILDEDFDEQVRFMKVKLRKRRPLWSRVFPWRITFTRR